VTFAGDAWAACAGSGWAVGSAAAVGVTGSAAGSAGIRPTALKYSTHAASMAAGFFVYWAHISSISQSLAPGSF